MINKLSDSQRLYDISSGGMRSTFDFVDILFRISNTLYQAEKS